MLAGQAARALRMLDGLRNEGEAAVLVHWTLAEDIRGLKRVKDALAAGKPLPLALREARVWGAKERIFERAVTLLSESTLAHLLEAAHVCDGLVKGLKHPDWPLDPWEALKRLVLMLAEQTGARRHAADDTPGADRLGRCGAASLRRTRAAARARARRSVARGSRRDRRRACSSVASAAPPRAAVASHTVPTGLSGVPPPGPAMPVTATAKLAGERASAPSAIARATSALTAPCAAISAAATPSSSVLAAFE